MGTRYATRKINRKGLVGRQMILGVLDDDGIGGRYCVQ